MKCGMTNIGFNNNKIGHAMEVKAWSQPGIDEYMSTFSHMAAYLDKKNQ